LGIEALANGIGVSLANYKAHHGTLLALEGLGQLSASMTATEVAQAARHEALNLIASAMTNVTEIEEQLSGLPSSARAVLAGGLEELTNDLLATTVAIDKIRLATRPPSFEERRHMALETVWQEVIHQLSGRLHYLGITPKYSSSGQRPVVDIYPDWFRQVFLHLILNSIDAFSGKGFGTEQPPKKGREIRLSVDPGSSGRSSVLFRYNDNAGGINGSRLLGPFADMPLEQRIFAANVTSKGDQGSGWGLYLIRRILDLHQASIDLERSRGGVTFKIQIPMVTED
jgi:signal transduction histidine kinase